MRATEVTRQRVALGSTLSGIIAAVAYRRKLITRSGIAGTIFVGTLVFGYGGIAGSLVVLFFFVSSSLLSHLSSARKRRVAADKFSKSATRDLGQVLANGGVGALAALGYGVHPRHPDWLLGAFVGAFATATADTWATEVGTLSRATPRLIISGRKVAPGTSGGITVAGTSAAMAGALALGLVAGLASHSHGARKLGLRKGLVAGGMMGGIAGALFDSLLGATVQQVHFCPHCESETERRIHQCGTVTVPLRGVDWIDNDMVNLLSTAVGAIVAAGVIVVSALMVGHQSKIQRP
ncbi:MAG: DUF92 domain-containing protein [Herpetosiphonaceae bacterium]|nr:DUF92 domain-containing protein [Herpetosiphonaceae bacterium]